MKTFELLRFDLKILPHNKVGNDISTIALYFNDHCFLEHTISFPNKLLRINFYEKCSLHKKHQIRIVGNGDCKLQIVQLTINSTNFNNLDNQDRIIYKSTEEIHTFEFESPYAYYFLGRVQI